MYVEAPVEVTITDKTFTSNDPYDLKLWLQRGFKQNSCYRVSDFKAGPARTFKAVVAINARILPEPEWKQLEKPERNKEVRRWYAMDKGRSTLEEIVGLLERSAASTAGAAVGQSAIVTAGV